ncbi:MAG: type II toxin-antitoxin system RelE/ParE family toxin [Bacteroidales bacterium]|nr:type II toxin-antitoxin system RelE/ParE family toxin [Bacteroidales bacterium]
MANKPYNKGQDYCFIYPGLRGYHIGHHLVFYTIQENGRVLIVRILHEKMDFKRHL